MRKVVVYGSVPDNPLSLKRFDSKLEIVYEDDPINARNFHTDAEAIVLFTNSVLTEEFLGGKLQLVINRATGTDNIRCIEKLAAKGIKLLRGVSYATQAVAEYSLGCILHSCSNAYFASRGKLPRAEVSSKNVVIVGYGAIGQKLAGMLSTVGCHVDVVSEQVDITLPPHTSRSILEQALPRADIVSFHASLKKSNVDLADDGFFAQLKKGAVFINAARGEEVSNKALLKALNDDTISAAYLDLVAQDSFTKRILGHQKVIYTGYTAWKTPESLERSHKFLIEALEQLV